MCIFVCGICLHLRGGQKKASELLVLELLAVMNSLKWVSGTKHGSSARAANAFNP